MGSQGGEDSGQGGNWRTRAGEVAAGAAGQAVADRPGSAKFACRKTWRNN